MSWTYVTSSDWRITDQEQRIQETADWYLNNNERKRENVPCTLALLFGIKNLDICANKAFENEFYPLYLNFIKKFQFPNPKPRNFIKTIEDSILLAPLREIIKVLYYLKKDNDAQAYLTYQEISDFIFYNNSVAKTNGQVNYELLINNILLYRNNRILPESIASVEEKSSEWTNGRSINELIKILSFCNFIFIEDTTTSKIVKFKNFNTYKNCIKDIVNYNKFFIIDPNWDKGTADAKWLEYLNEDFSEFIMTSINSSDTSQTTKKFNKSEYSTNFNRNRILFGAPGTGKSFRLNKERTELLQNENDFERVTFHPDYSYANFVGTYKPVPIVDENGKESISYKYTPGPFMRVYVKALKSIISENPKPYLLIIEEINRANVAAVFGDIFQLLDRNEYGASEYEIQATEDIKKYLAEELGGDPEEYTSIKIPNNMFIWATMNSADQGVFPMDTAFKRRWEFTYMGINDGEEDLKNIIINLADNTQSIYWNDLRKAINNKLSNLKLNEDKLLGPYFISPQIFKMEKYNDKFIESFKNKVLMYLFDDAAKQKRSSLFSEKIDTTKYSSICNNFDKIGINIFCNEIASIEGSNTIGDD